MGVKNEKNIEVESKKFSNILADFEVHISAVLFMSLTIMLMVQVISRYVFKHAFTWTEELANIVYVFIVYLGISSAVKHRKHLSIDFFVSRMPFKVKKVLLIVSNIIFIVFCGYMMIPLMAIVKDYEGLGGAKSPLLLIPKVISFGIIPVAFIFTIGRLIQDTIKLYAEEEKELGYSKPTIDLTIAEREWENKKRSINKEV